MQTEDHYSNIILSDIVGIIFIGLVITAISAGFKRIEKRILRYKETAQ